MRACVSPSQHSRLQLPSPPRDDGDGCHIGTPSHNRTLSRGANTVGRLAAWTVRSAETPRKEISYGPTVNRSFSAKVNRV